MFLPYAGYAEIVVPDSQQVSARNLNGKYNWIGMVPDIVEYMAESLNFTYDLALSRDGYWGSYDEDIAEWNGIIKDLMDDAADVGLAPLTVLHERAEAVDFLLPIHSDRSTFVIGRESSFNNGFTTNFTRDTWKVIGIVVVLSALALALVVKVGKEKMGTEFKLEQCFIYTCGALCAFGVKRWHTTPVTVSARSDSFQKWVN